jgi:hypothetical protein
VRLPVIKGLIRRRLLINFRVDADVMRRFLPPPFRPQLHRGYTIAGICLIRLEQLRPRWLPGSCGLASENAAHRVAVVWNDPAHETREGVYIPHRDTSSWANLWAGGRLFPGEHNAADFDVADDGTKIALSVRARDGGMSVCVAGRESDAWPTSSCFSSFSSLEESSAFFARGSLGYSVTRDRCHYDGLTLDTEDWRVRPLEINHVESSFFSDESIFPAGSVTFDHALVMRDLRHHWHAAPDLSATA